MKLSCKVFSLLLLSISFLACNNSKTSEKKEAEQVENTQTQSAKQAFVSSVEEIHKKERFLKEDFVTLSHQYSLHSRIDHCLSDGKDDS
jgi:hypothetical protein